MYIHAYTNTYRAEMNPENFRHGIEDSVPHVHELVLMNDESDLRNWITRNPEDIERQFRHKTPLLMTIKYDAYDCFTVLMDHNSNVEEYNPQNETTIIVAARLNRTQMIKDLISKNAIIRNRDRMGRTVVEILISRDDVDTIQFIHFQRGTLLHHDLYSKEFPLTLAVSHQARQCITYILSLKPRAQSFLIHRKFSCPVSVAIRMNDLKTLTALTQLEDFKYIINRQIHKSVSYLHLAVENARPQIVELLLNNGAAVNLLDNEKNTPAHYVSDIPTLRLLIRHGARIDKINKLGETPLKTAERNKRNCIYHYLRLYEGIIRTRPQQYYNDRFGGYYRDHIQQRLEAGFFTQFTGNSLESLDIDPLPQLFDEMPALEEAPVNSSVSFCVPKPVETSAIISFCGQRIPPNATSRPNTTTPTLKVRHVQRLLERMVPTILPPDNLQGLSESEEEERPENVSHSGLY
jgi:ankyrin repeat protein